MSSGISVVGGGDALGVVGVGVEDEDVVERCFVEGLIFSQDPSDDMVYGKAVENESKCWLCKAQM